MFHRLIPPIILHQRPELTTREAEFSASSISAITQKLDEQLEQFSRRPLEPEFPYVVVDARYERVREGGVIVSRAILIALGIGWEGRRQVLAVEYANRESQSSWRGFLLQFKERGLKGVQFVASDDHPGLKAAIREVLPGVSVKETSFAWRTVRLPWRSRRSPDWCGMSRGRRRFPEIPSDSSRKFPPHRSQF